MIDQTIITIGNDANEVLRTLEQCMGPVEDFKHVHSNLERWADDTIIGQNVKDSIYKINDGLDALFEITRELMISVRDFSERQHQMNMREVQMQAEIERNRMMEEARIQRL